MTDSPFLPAHAAATFGDPSDRAAQTPLAEAPTVALAFALGYACARPQNANSFGPFCAVVEELMARPAVEGDTALAGGQWGALMRLLPPAQARAITLLYEVQRGQRWARTGERHPK
ncbi:hypothetical protein SEA_ZENTENO07_71 [Mycobacterium phage Zenteno07]|nr:hypothetical protein SEA_ZENTENO07_71 [Mycobacterium phage Zenteno07]